MAKLKQKPIKAKAKLPTTKKQKLSDAQFFGILRENAGLFARTARAIQTQYNVAYTRQAVQDRARKHPEILVDIDEENIDVAEEGLNSIMRSKSEKNRLEAVKFYLKHKGRKRGYIEKVATDITIKKVGKALEDEEYT